MKKITKITTTAMIVLGLFGLTGCIEEETTPNSGSRQDAQNTTYIGDRLASNQPTPTDLDFSLERYNLIRRTYWVNGQREKAMTVQAPSSNIPLSYVVLLSDSGAVVGNFICDGKVTSLNSFLAPESEFFEAGHDSPNSNGSRQSSNKWLPDVDGAYGTNDNGIFFFTPDGKYIEWKGAYLYSDQPFDVKDPVLKVKGSE